MSKHYRVKAFSKLTSVTVRTLQYYDEINLLKPNGKTVSGHRLYSEMDMLKLQQITTLKFLGFSLKEIKKLLAKMEPQVSVLLGMQQGILDKQIAKLQQAQRLLQQISKMLQVEGIVDWKLYAKIIEVLNMQQVDIKSWVNQYLSQEEMKQFKNLWNKYSPQQMQDYGDRWQAMFKKVKTKLHTDPTSKVGEQLFTEWMQLVDELYNGYPEISQKMWEAFKAGAAPTDTMPYFNQEVIDYIAKAAEYHYKKQ